MRGQSRVVWSPAGAIFKGLESGQPAVSEATGAVGGVNWEEDRAGLHDDYAWCEPVLVSKLTKDAGRATYHIGGTHHLLMGLNFGSNTDASHKGTPGILQSQLRS